MILLALEVVTHVRCSVTVVRLEKEGRVVPVKIQMKREIVDQPTLSLLAARIQFIEIPHLYPTFDIAFEHALSESGLTVIYSYVLELDYLDPQDLIDNSNRPYRL